MLFEKKTGGFRRPRATSRTSYKRDFESIPDLPPLPSKTLSRPSSRIEPETASIPPSTRASIISSSILETAPSVKRPSITAATSVAAFLKLKMESAQLITVSSDGSPVKESPKRKPVKTVPATQITTELIDKDEESQTQFRLSMFTHKSPPINTGNAMPRFTRQYRSPSSVSDDRRSIFKRIGSISEDRKFSFQGHTSHDNNSSSEFKVSDYEEDTGDVIQSNLFDSADADVVFLSSDKEDPASDKEATTHFRVHSTNLMVHSPVLSELVYKVEDEDVGIVLQEDSTTLKLLFGLMYNAPAEQLGPDDWQRVVNLAQCAEKYQFARGKEAAVAYFTDQERRGAISPFLTYSFAIHNSLPNLEAASAERSTSYDMNSLPESIFSMMGFTNFQKLAAYHSRRQAYYSDVLNSIAIDPRDLSEQCYQSNGTCVILPWNNLKQKLTWSKTDRSQTERRHRPDFVMAELATEIGQIDCGTCCRALVQAALQAKRAMESMPSYLV